MVQHVPATVPDKNTKNRAEKAGILLNIGLTCAEWQETLKNNVAPEMLDV